MSEIVYLYVQVFVVIELLITTKHRREVERSLEGQHGQIK